MNRTEHVGQPFRIAAVLERFTASFVRVIAPKGVRVELNDHEPTPHSFTPSGNGGVHFEARSHARSVASAFVIENHGPSSPWENRMGLPCMTTRRRTHPEPTPMCSVYGLTSPPPS